jgi:sensor domain CHASE-containing protein
MRVFNSFILWLILLILCWPLALLALVLYPCIWLLLLPFRLVGITVDAVFELLRALLFLPVRLLGARPTH